MLCTCKLRTSQEFFQAFQNRTTLSPSTKLRNNSEKVVIKKLLGEDEKESIFFSKKQKYSMGLKVNILLSLKLCACNRVQ